MTALRLTWRESVAAAVTRLTRRLGRQTFPRNELIRSELPRIVTATRSDGQTPWQTLSRVLQELRDSGQLEFVAPGHYRALRDELR
jgi:putative restriction endonuclease